MVPQTNLKRENEPCHSPVGCGSSTPPWHRAGANQGGGSRRTATLRLNLEVQEDRLTPSFTWNGYFPNLDYGMPPPPPLAADVTSDGIDDLIELWSGGVSVRPGRGDGTFADPISSNVQTGSTLALDDFNGDGHLDIFSLADDDGTLGPETPYFLSFGEGDGTFREIGIYSTGLGAVHSYWTQDVNGDGRPDVVVSGEAWNGGPASAQLLNDGIWGPSLSISDSSVKEGHSGTVAATFTIALSEPCTQPVTVAYATGNGSAIAGSDYQAASGTLTFAPGETSKTITVPVNGDRLGEPNETFVVNLSSPTNATIADGVGVGTIADDEPRISISDVSKKEGKKNQTTQFIFTVTLSAAYDQAVTMSFRTVNGTAKTGDDDYVAKSGTLTFNPGETSKTITIVVNGDGKKEANETFYLDLSDNSSNSLFTKNRGVGTIQNDD